MEWPGPRKQRVIENTKIYIKYYNKKLGLKIMSTDVKQ